MKFDTGSIWTPDSLMRYPALREPKNVDVVIVGAGITGLMTAYTLQQQGATVAVLERDQIGTGETSRTTAHLTHMVDRSLTALQEDFGIEHAIALWDAGVAAIDRIHEVIHAEGIECDFRWVPGYYHEGLDAAPAPDSAAFRRDVHIANQNGFEATFVSQIPIFKRMGMQLPRQAKFHPTRFIQGLAAAVERNGRSIFEHTEVTQFIPDTSSVIAGGQRVNAGAVVIATHVPLQGWLSTVKAALFQTKLFPYTSYVVRAEIPEEELEEALYWDMSEPYFYLRIDRERGKSTAIFGGCDRKTGQEENPKMIFPKLEDTLRRYLPEAVVTHRWAGQVIETHDGLPFIGEMAANQFTATGFSGNGLTLGALASILIGDALSGRTNPWKDLFSPDRFRVRAGVWDYITENVDYPYYMAKQLVLRHRRDGLGSLAPGEGCVFIVDGKRIAAARSDDGKLHTVSAYCTHMGCEVKWNDALASWDCPCHGSRFTPDGKVIGGPAETPLEKIPVTVK